MLSIALDLCPSGFSGSLEISGALVSLVGEVCCLADGVGLGGIANDVPMSIEFKLRSWSITWDALFELGLFLIMCGDGGRVPIPASFTFPPMASYFSTISVIDDLRTLCRCLTSDGASSNGLLCDEPSVDRKGSTSDRGRGLEDEIPPEDTFCFRSLLVPVGSTFDKLCSEGFINDSGALNGDK